MRETFPWQQFWAFNVHRSQSYQPLWTSKFWFIF